MVDLTFLEQDEYRFDDEGFEVSLLGLTLWPRRREDQKANIGVIIQACEGLHNAINQRADDSIIWLRQQVASIRGQPDSEGRVIMLMSHYATSLNQTSYGTESWADGR